MDRSGVGGPEAGRSGMSAGSRRWSLRATGSCGGVQEGFHVDALFPRQYSIGLTTFAGRCPEKSIGWRGADHSGALFAVVPADGTLSGSSSILSIETER